MTPATLGLDALGSLRTLRVALYTPEPTQDIHRKYRDARSGGDAGRAP